MELQGKKEDNDKNDIEKVLRKNTKTKEVYWRYT